jgi:hypothetical protein
LIFAATVQAVHLCGPQLSSANTEFQIQAAAPGNGVCLACVMAHSSATAFVFVVSAPASLRAPVIPAPQLSRRSFLDQFHLQVRPPPAV